MASTEALDKRLTALEALMKEVIRASETATRAYAENREPLNSRIDSLRSEIRTNFVGLDERLRKLEGEV